MTCVMMENNSEQCRKMRLRKELGFKETVKK